MNRSSFSKGAVITLLCATVLLTVGMAIIYNVFRNYEWAVLAYEEHNQLITAIHQYSYKLMVGMGMVSLGLGVGLLSAVIFTPCSLNMRIYLTAPLVLTWQICT